MYAIYQHYFPNGKRYFGVTKTSPTKRWGYNGYNYKTQVVGRAIEKYGWENIEHDIIEVCETKDEAEELERWLIAKYDTTNPNNGYNVLPGGDIAENDKTQEIRKSLGNGMRGKHHSEETKKKISDGLKRATENGTRIIRRGVKPSEETREKMRKARAEWYKKGDNAEKDAERMRNISNRLWANPDWREKQLANLAKYRRKPGEFVWTEESKKKLSETNKGRWLRDNGTTARPVVQLTKNGEFVARYGCITSAAEAIKPDGFKSVMSIIGKCCRHKNGFNTCHGFIWLYEEEYYAKINGHDKQLKITTL